MEYVGCVRCGKIQRITNMQDSVCEDCRSVEFSDYVIAALGETMPYVAFYAKVRKEARRLGLTQDYRTPDNMEY